MLWLKSVKRQKIALQKRTSSERSILTSLMEESNPDKDKEVITLDDNDLPALTSGSISGKVEDLKRALEFLKEFKNPNGAHQCS